MDALQAACTAEVALETMAGPTGGSGAAGGEHPALSRCEWGGVLAVSRADEASILVVLRDALSDDRNESPAAATCASSALAQRHGLSFIASGQPNPVGSPGSCV